MTEQDVVIVGGGVAGLTVGVFTARAELNTTVVNAGTSILNRSAHLENFPGFPAGLSPRLFLDLLKNQYEEAGGELIQAKVTNVRQAEERFLVKYGGEEHLASNVVCASWYDVDYLNGMDVAFQEEGSKTFIRTDRWGRTSIDGIYAAGRIGGDYHQAIVASGSGATTALTLLKDEDCDFYHDWVTPEGYFTGRDRDVPVGCDEIPQEEWEERSEEGKRVMELFFESHGQSNPELHPSQKHDD